MALLEKKVIVVTGVGAGLGRSYSLDLARNGATLVLNDIDADGLAATEAAVREIGVPVTSRVGSVCDWQHATELVAAGVEAFGQIDGLVNNAGTHYVVPSPDDTPERMREIMEINILGTQFPGTAAIRQMLSSGSGGVILNVSSGASSGMPFVASYSASKGAIASLTWSWAVELRDKGIRVNGIDPAAYTRQVQNTMDVRPSPVIWSTDKIAPLVTYLMSDLSGSMTGQIVRLWGDDLHLMAHHEPMAPWLSDENWTVDKLDRAFRDQLAPHLQRYARDMTEYEPFPTVTGPGGG